jgi:TPR repeat protein
MNLNINVPEDEKKEIDKTLEYYEAFSDEYYQVSKGLHETVTEYSEEGMFYFWRSCAQMNYAPAMHQAAEMYEFGIGTEVDKSAAKMWYMRAATEYFQSQIALADLLVSGDGLEIDEEQGHFWFHNLFRCYWEWHFVLKILEDKAKLRGGETPEYPLKVLEWLEKFAEEGVAEVQYSLGWIYFKHMTTTTDMRKSYDYFKKASKQGYSNAHEIVTDLRMGWVNKNKKSKSRKDN